MNVKFRTRPRIAATLIVAVFFFSAASDDAAAQARYDDHEYNDRIFVTLGGYKTPNFSSRLRVDPKGIGIGTVIDLEDRLALDRDITVFRIDGYYRLNRAHRFEWTFYEQNRDGTTVLLHDDLEIGDVVYPADFSINSEFNIRVLKASYAWSFINTAKYDFFLGGGLNVRDITTSFHGVGTVLGNTEVRTFDDRDRVPLPTLTAGMHYNISDNIRIRFRVEAFAIRVDDSSGRWNDNSLMVDYRIGERIGIGGGINLSSVRLQSESDEDRNIESETSQGGLMMYVSARF
jgi:hypothetical protein